MCHPSVIRCHKLRRHDGGNTLRSQDHREELRALPLNRVECAKFDRQQQEIDALSAKIK